MERPAPEPITHMASLLSRSPREATPPLSATLVEIRRWVRAAEPETSRAALTLAARR